MNQRSGQWRHPKISVARTSDCSCNYKSVGMAGKMAGKALERQPDWRCAPFGHAGLGLGDLGKVRHKPKSLTDCEWPTCAAARQTKHQKNAGLEPARWFRSYRVPVVPVVESEPPPRPPTTIAAAIAMPTIAVVESPDTPDAAPVAPVAPAVPAVVDRVVPGVFPVPEPVAGVVCANANGEESARTRMDAVFSDFMSLFL